MRAVQVLAESFTDPMSFYGYRCESLENAKTGNCHDEPVAFINDAESGINKNTSGIFHVITRAQSKYSLGRQDKKT